MKNVLFIAFYYNHNNEIASKRLQGIAKYLPKYGWNPIVLVPKTDNPTVKINNIKVVETEYEDMLAKFLPNKSNSTSVEQRKPKNPSFSDKLLSKGISLAGEFFAYPDGMKYWFKPAMKESRILIEEYDIKGIISSSFPVTAHKIAHNLKNEYNIPWIADLRDLWNLNPYFHHTAIRNYFEMKLEKKTFENVDVLTTTTPLAKQTLSTIHGNKKIVSVVSGYDPDDFKNIKAEKTSNKLTLMYAGSLYDGKRNPSLLFKAINELIHDGKINANKITIDFYGDKTNLKELSQKYSIEDIVNIHGKINHDEVLKRQLGSDVLLLISWMDPKEKMFIPGKVYEYMGSQKPILSIGYKEGSLKDLIEKTNIGYHVSTLEDTKKVILDYYNQFIENNKVKYKGNEFSNSYSMEATGKQFSELLNEELK